MSTPAPLTAVEETAALLERVIAHRNAYIVKAVDAADVADHGDAERFMRTANEFARMGDRLYAWNQDALDKELYR
jgi:hypothetical protein